MTLLDGKTGRCLATLHPELSLLWPKPGCGVSLFPEWTRLARACPRLVPPSASPIVLPSEMDLLLAILLFITASCQLGVIFQKFWLLQNNSCIAKVVPFTGRTLCHVSTERSRRNSSRVPRQPRADNVLKIKYKGAFRAPLQVRSDLALIEYWFI